MPWVIERQYGHPSEPDWDYFDGNYPGDRKTPRYTDLPQHAMQFETEEEAYQFIEDNQLPYSSHTPREMEV